MKRRIFLSALVGSSVASFWVLYVVATAPNSSLTHSSVLAITAPASADAVVAALENNGESALRLGEVVAATDDTPRVAYEGRLNLAG